MILLVEFRHDLEYSILRARRSGWENGDTPQGRQGNEKRSVKK